MKHLKHKKLQNTTYPHNRMRWRWASWQEGVHTQQDKHSRRLWNTGPDLRRTLAYTDHDLRGRKGTSRVLDYQLNLSTSDDRRL